MFAAEVPFTDNGFGGSRVLAPGGPGNVARLGREDGRCSTVSRCAIFLGRADVSGRDAFGWAVHARDIVGTLRVNVSDFAPIEYLFVVPLFAGSAVDTDVDSVVPA